MKVFWKKEKNEYKKNREEEYYLHGHTVEENFGPTVYGHVVHNGQVVRNFSVDAKDVPRHLLKQIQAGI